MTFYESIVRPLLFRLPPETVHELGMAALRSGLANYAIGWSDARFELGPIERFGLSFANPLGLAAGFDKNAAAARELLSIGFGFVEVGTVTLEPQLGNPRPRLFRLPADAALINRLGFNNHGATELASRLHSGRGNGIIGVNIGRNKEVDNDAAIENYLACYEIIYHVADYVVINVSSPNTPNLRDLQRADAVEELVKALLDRRREMAGSGGGKPLLIKIAPDLSEIEIEAIADAAVRLGLSGIVATNTTVERAGLSTPNPESFGAGGLSGKPLAKRSTQVIEKIARHSKGQIPIIGVGGIFTPEDAFEKIAAGASLVQAYTGFVYQGPGFARTIVDGLNRMLIERGFTSYDEAVGSAL
jgi:dihydroorotate dehydrogenase